MEFTAGEVILPLAIRRARVDVVMVPAPGVLHPPAQDALKKKRKRIWNNRSRNKHIAEVAESIITFAKERLSGFRFRDEAIEALGAMFDRRVAILVDCPEHGRRFLELLKGWQMLDLIPRTETVVPPETEAPSETVKPQKNCLIITAAFAAMNGIGADVVIRATGTPWPLRLKRFPPLQGRTEPNVVVIDFVEECGSGVPGECRRRMEDYRRRGWRLLTS
jgi:hypothetical protein